MVAYIKGDGISYMQWLFLHLILDLKYVYFDIKTPSEGNSLTGKGNPLDAWKPC